MNVDPAQLQFVFENLYKQALKVLPKEYKALGDLISIDGSLIDPDTHIFYDAVVLLGTPGQNQTKKPVRVVGYKVAGVKYYIATDRRDLTAEQIATIYKLRWTIESFFQWWKEHLKVYHLIARSEYGLMVQILGGLITYLLMAIYCREHFDEKVTIKRVRELRTTILNELFHGQDSNGATMGGNNIGKEQRKSYHAKT